MHSTVEFFFFLAFFLFYSKCNSEWRSLASEQNLDVAVSLRLSIKNQRGELAVLRDKIRLNHVIIFSMPFHGCMMSSYYFSFFALIAKALNVPPVSVTSASGLLLYMHSSTGQQTPSHLSRSPRRFPPPLVPRSLLVPAVAIVISLFSLNVYM